MSPSQWIVEGVLGHADRSYDHRGEAECSGVWLGGKGRRAPGPVVPPGGAASPKLTRSFGFVEREPPVLNFTQ
jgi:hypothetical protein